MSDETRPLHPPEATVSVSSPTHPRSLLRPPTQSRTAKGIARYLLRFSIDENTWPAVFSSAAV